MRAVTVGAVVTYVSLCAIRAEQSLEAASSFLMTRHQQRAACSLIHTYSHLRVSACVCTRMTVCVFVCVCVCVVAVVCVSLMK